MSVTDDQRLEEEAVRRGIAETVALERARGEEFAGTAPHQRLDPLARLLALGLITRQQRMAGLRYGNQYKQLYDVRKGSKGSRAPFERKTADALRVNRLRAEALGNDFQQIFLLDQVCGRDIMPEKLWGPQWAGLVVEHLDVALTNLAIHYGMIWAHDVD